MKISGAKIVMECLLEQGVDTVFGYPGGTILNVYDELYKYGDRIRHILTAHEQGASHAADGYARATGRVGVCFATSGPGATNLTTGIATACMDSSPVVFLTVNCAESLLGKDAFQEVDISGIGMPITKASYLVKDIGLLAGTIREAFALAAGGRPGPVLIDITKNVTAEQAEYEFVPRSEHLSGGWLKRIERRRKYGIYADEPAARDIDRLVRLVEEAQRPMILAGGGVILSGASEELRQFAELIDSPVSNTLMGMGSMPGAHPLFTGMVGMHGSQASNYAVSHCDLLIALGMRFSDRVATDPQTFARDAKIVQIDIDEAEMGKNVKCDLHVLADAKKALQALLSRVKAGKRPEWTEQAASRKPRRSRPCADEPLRPWDIPETVFRLTDGRATIVTDVGQHQMWSAQNYAYERPRQLLTSGGFGTMGFGYGAAMGAKLGTPDALVVHMTGDGCFRMNCNEMATARHYGIPVVTLIFNNGVLGMVRQWQTLMYERRYSQTTLDRGPDFVKLAEAYGVWGRRVGTVGELEEAFREAAASGEPAVIDCRLDMDEKVAPMVAGGTPLTQFLLD